MNAQLPSSALGLGLYPLPDAARLVQLDPQTARRWAEGYSFKYRGQRRESPGVVGLTMARIGGRRDLTFPEMLTLRLVKGFRGAGLSLPTIKKVARLAQEEFGTVTPFATKRFRTDGRAVFLELKTQTPANDEQEVPPRDRELINVLTRQREFADIVEPSLFQNVDWDFDIATRWWPLGSTRAVVLDPTALFGAPHVRETRIPTEVLARAVHAEGGGEGALAAVADWYGIDVNQVRDAVDYETMWLRPAA
jgi:uncharacterized protein (DUF433 family)